MIDDFDNLEKFQLEDYPLPTHSAAAPTPHKRRSDLQFVKVPLMWKDRLAKAGAHGATYALALHLLYHDWKSNESPIKLSNTALADDGITRWQKWRALRELEQLGLAVVERRPRKSPIVRVVKL
jgi:hypothetical protein